MKATGVEEVVIDSGEEVIGSMKSKAVSILGQGMGMSMGAYLYRDCATIAVPAATWIGIEMAIAVRVGA